jgi:outer membrane lipase/esterase
MKPLALLAALFAFIVLNAPGAADAAGFNQFIGFGDSTLDTGYFRYASTGNLPFDAMIVTSVSEGNTGAFVANGVMNSTMLANRFGLLAAPSTDGGTNYANGDSYTTSYGTPGIPSNVSGVAQIKEYLASVNGVANPNALYIIKCGDNDLHYVNPPSDYLSNSAQAIAKAAAVLQAAGARTIMIPNSYNYAVYDGPGGSISNSSSAAAYATSESYFTERWADLSAAGVHFIPADIDSLFKYVVCNPTLFGFTLDSVQTDHRATLNYSSSLSSALLAYPLLTPAQQQGGLWIDAVHLTTAGQTIEADYEYSLLTAPSEISLLAESVVQGGWARAATIQGQIELSEQHRGPTGFNAWESTGAYSLQVKNAPGFTDGSGNPFGGTLGIDYQLPDGIIVGVAFTMDSQMQGFSTGGDFNQVDEAPSLYAAYAAGPWWGNAVASYDLFQDKIVRPVPLGIFTDQNNGTTTGQSLSLALRGGCDFSLGQFTTGPVAGMVLQDVRVYGFTESGTSGVTALSYGSQTRESFVSQLGWRVWTDLGKFHPFAEASWNHECAGKSRMITASLTSVAAPSYTMDAVPMASNWDTTSLGGYYKLTPNVILRGAASAMIFSPQMITCGGEFGLNVSF